MDDNCYLVLRTISKKDNKSYSSLEEYLENFEFKIEREEIVRHIFFLKENEYIDVFNNNYGFLPTEKGREYVFTRLIGKLNKD